MYAVIETGGKQYRVKQGQTLRVETLPGEAGDAIKLDKVLLVGEGAAVKVGTPYLNGGTVAATIKNHGRGVKLKIVKFRRRKHHQKITGHRQNYTEIEITGISAA